MVITCAGDPVTRTVLEQLCSVSAVNSDPPSAARARPLHHGQDTGSCYTGLYHTVRPYNTISIGFTSTFNENNPQLRICLWAINSLIILVIKLESTFIKIERVTD